MAQQVRENFFFYSKHHSLAVQPKEICEKKIKNVLSIIISYEQKHFLLFIIFVLSILG